MTRLGWNGYALNGFPGKATLILQRGKKVIEANFSLLQAATQGRTFDCPMSRNPSSAPTGGSKFTNQT
jgi:hypothetical protein